MAGWIWPGIMFGTVALVAVAAAVVRRSAGRPQRPEHWALRHVPVVFLGGALIALVASVMTYRLVDGPDKDRFDAAIKVVTGIAAVVAGLLTWGRLELSRHEHGLAIDRDLTDRYNRAVELLGSNDSLVQVGGIFALERFALDAARRDGARGVDWGMALDVISALARKLSKEAREAQIELSATSHDGDSDVEPLFMDAPSGVLEAVRVLGRFRERSGRNEMHRHDLSGVLLSGVDLTRATLSFSDLKGADLRGAYLSSALLLGADLRDANLQFASIANADLASADLSGADLRDTKLSDAQLSYANLVRADLRLANLSRADLRFADLTDAVLAGANLPLTDLRDTNLAGADLAGAKLVEADARGAMLTGTNLDGAFLVSADLRDAKLTHANLSQAKLRGAKLADADLTGVCLVGADLRGVDLRAANLNDADLGSDPVYNETTQWPEGFVPPEPEPREAPADPSIS